MASILMAFPLFNIAQHAITLDVGQMAAGKNIRVGYAREIGPKFKFETGVRYHINNPNDYDSRGYSYLYRMKAFKPIEHFGLYVNGSMRVLSDRSNTFQLSLFTDIEAGRMGYYSVHFSESDKLLDTNGNTYTLSNTYQHPAIWHVQGTLGLAVTGHFNENIGAFLRVGTGPVLLKETTHSYWDQLTQTQVILLSNQWTFDSIFSPFVRVGLIYRWNKLNKEKPISS